jgi:hypothetical protein
MLTGRPLIKTVAEQFAKECFDRLPASGEQSVTQVYQIAAQRLGEIVHERTICSSIRFRTAASLALHDKLIYQRPKNEAPLKRSLEFRNQCSTDLVMASGICLRFSG